MSSDQTVTAVGSPSLHDSETALGSHRPPRTLAALYVRGEDAQWDEHNWPERQHGQYAVTLSAGDALFWRTFNVAHTEQVRRR